MSLEEGIVAALRLENAAEVDHDNGWELWKYRVRDPASQTPLPDDLFLLFLNSRSLRARLEVDSDVARVRELRSRLRDNGTNGRLSIIVQRSSPTAKYLELIEAELKPRSIKYMSQILQEQWQHLLGDSQPEENQLTYFIEPIVDDKLALSKLEDWVLVREVETPLAEDQNGGRPSIAVLLAPAGMGKTSVARQLARRLKLRDEHDVIPILIEPMQWSLLNPHEEPTLWVLIEHALKSNGYNAVPREIFDLFARTGYFSIIFDGLDEVGSIRGGKITPVDVIEQLRNLAADLDCRVLLTSRDSLWSELVPNQIRHAIREFKLLPFRNREIGKYREKRFPIPNSPERNRFDRILQEITNAVHPETTANVPFEERVLGTPLILELIATEAEEYSEAPDGDTLSSTQYKNLLYTITYSILNREHEGRKLLLTPNQQFLMISSLVVEMGKGPYSAEDVITTTEDALGKTLSISDKHALEIAIKSHALIRRTGEGSYAFRFDYLAQLAPAVWICNYIIEARQDSIVERYLSSLSGRSSPVSAYVADLLKERDWRALIGEEIRNVKQGDSIHYSNAPFFWEIAQSLLPPPGQESRSARSSAMAIIFGTLMDGRLIFSGLQFSGPIVYMDFRRAEFQGCGFRNCEWINCEADENTKFDNCDFKGRFVSVQSSGLRSALFEPLSEENVDDEARADLAGLLNRPHLLSVSETAVARMATAILRTFRASGFFVPRTKNYLQGLFLEPTLLRDAVLRKLMDNAILEEEPSRGLQIVNKNSGAVIALLDNGNQKGAVKITIKSVVDHFKLARNP